jgi:nifR3 family TIM-barrel protein
MQKGFWKKLADKASPPAGGEKRPILASASMANVTDAAFRRMLAKYGKPDVIWTEFVSCDGLCSEGKEKLLQDLIFDKSERPIVAQFFGAKPENFYKCALMAQELGFDGIDINMGCPDKGVVRQGAGAALIKNPKLAQEIIKETLRGAGSLPVSVKTRIGFNEIEYKNWIPKLLKMDLTAITIHGRTKKEMSKVPAHWDIIADIVKMRNKFKSETLIIGNGDVASLADAQEKYEKYKVDGVMIGRALFGNPYFFSGNWQGKNKEVSPKTKLKLALEHTKLFEKIFGNIKHFEIMKKHYKAYVSGFDDAKKMRGRLMKVKNLNSAKKTLNSLISAL